jgi:hypothetical protein
MRIPIAVTLCLLGLACSSGIERMGESHPARPDNWPISVYATGGAPAGAVELAQAGHPPGRPIGKLTISDSRGSSWMRVISEARTQARNLGGDSVLVTGGDMYWKRISVTVYRNPD